MDQGQQEGSGHEHRRIQGPPHGQPFPRRLPAEQLKHEILIGESRRSFQVQLPVDGLIRKRRHGKCRPLRRGGNFNLEVQQLRNSYWPLEFKSNLLHLVRCSCHPDRPRANASRPVQPVEIYPETQLIRLPKRASDPDRDADPMERLGRPKGLPGGHIRRNWTQPKGRASRADSGHETGTNAIASQIANPNITDPTSRRDIRDPPHNPIYPPRFASARERRLQVATLDRGLKKSTLIGGELIDRDVNQIDPQLL